MKKMVLALGLTSALMGVSPVWANPEAASASTEAPLVVEQSSAPEMTVATVPQIEATPSTPEPAEAEPVLDTGDTAWILVSTALVLLMTIPGLALFYGGMVRKKNVLGTMAYSLTAAAVVSVLWVVIGYTIAFGEGGAWLGDLSKLFLSGITKESLSGTIPEILFDFLKMEPTYTTIQFVARALSGKWSGEPAA